MSRRLWTGILLIVAAVAVSNYVPLLNQHAEQDSCVFGPVSNAEYRTHLARAKSELPLPTPSLFLNDHAFALRLRGLFEKLSHDETSVYSRVAIMHATLRAIGAEYRNTNGNRSSAYAVEDPYALATTASPTVAFNYALDVNRLWMFMPWPRDAWIIGALAGPRYGRPPGPLYPKGVGGVGFIVWGPLSSLKGSKGSEELIDGLCPPIPTAALAEGFSLKAQ
jgi:hypothetical protein